MKKTIFSAFLAVIFALALVFNVGAYSVTITDPAGDQIGQRGFDTFSITYEVNGLMSISIATNYPQSGVLVGSWPTGVADVLFDGSQNGPGWDYALVILAHDGFTSGQLYSIGSLYTSDDFRPASGSYRYGHELPVRLKTGTAVASWATGNWSWVPAGTNPDYNIVYSTTTWGWDDNLGRNLLRVGWATANCDNDSIVGAQVPEPGTLLLLGCGLAGLGFIKRKKLNN